LDFAKFLDLALVHVLLQLPGGVLVRQRGPLHQVVDNRLEGGERGRERERERENVLNYCKYAKS